MLIQSRRNIINARKHHLKCPAINLFPANTNLTKLERLRQVVGREKHKRQCPDKVADHTDKTAPQYQNRLLVARLATAAVRNGCATAEQQWMDRWSQ